MAEYVYRLITPTAWAQSQQEGMIKWSKADALSGYMHLSPQEEILETARRYFAIAKPPWVLEIHEKQLGDALRFEGVPSRNNTQFPHYYGRFIPLSAVTGIMRLQVQDNGSFGLGTKRAFSYKA